MTCMNKTILFAAKSNKDGLWECVPQHLLDTANVMKCLCDPQSGWVARAFISASNIERSIFQSVCIFIAAVHDIGKITPTFQNMIAKNSLPGLKERLAAFGFDIELEYSGRLFYHAFVSGAILHERFNINETICDIIAAHHGRPRGYGKDYSWRAPFKHHGENIFGKNKEFEILWKEIVEKAETIAGIKCEDLPQLSPQAQILISGLLITADWIASNEIFFPLADPWDTSALEDSGRGERGFIASGVKKGWSSRSIRFDRLTFISRFGFEPNALQRFAGRAAEAGAQLLIVEGPMGSGKTEAALMCSEIMAARVGAGGFFIGLPTQATSNGIFHRIITWANKTASDLSISVNLAHGGASFNDEYRALKVNSNDNKGTTISKWMSGRHRQLMADFVDGTIDQALAMSLNRKFFMLLHEQLAGKVIVFDEVHSYDAYTEAYLETTLAFLGIYQCPVVLLSATLTNEKRSAFIKAYSQGLANGIQNDNGYPCISWWDGESTNVEVIPFDDTKKMDVEIQWIQFQQLSAKIDSLLATGGCAGVIRNTVKEAIRTYNVLKESLTGYTIILIHSRFLMDERNSIEKKIINWTGKQSKIKDRDKLIVVGTQVLEQSLDLDFDVLFTDPCPMDLLFQRIGREHRHERVRPQNLIDAKLYMILDDERIIGSKGRPYQSYLINRTCNLIKSVGGKLSLPYDIKDMVEQTYDLSVTEESSDKEEFIYLLQNLKMRAKESRLPEPWNIKSIRGLAQENRQVDEYIGVRQSSNSRSVLLLKLKDNCIMDLNETASCRVGCIPDNATGEIFLRQIIHLPDYMITQVELSKMKKQIGFDKDSFWSNEEILLLDEKCGYSYLEQKRIKRFTYCSETGLMEEEYVR